MPLLDRQLHEVWDALRAQGNQRTKSLAEIRIRNLRGIKDLRIPFNYPVSVLAGPNGCGKSTVLFGCACAYVVPDRGPRDYVPSSLFPNFKGGGTEFEDVAGQTEIEFHYLHENERISMMWRRGKSWNRSFMGRKGGEQPERQLYMRTLANLTNPSEVRSILQLARKELSTEQITEDLLIFAHRILPRRYRALSRITTQTRDLLFAELEGTSAAKYSEFHMSSGERAILRISKDISSLTDALILIDEVEAGLHPYTQQQAMLEFQRIALRNRLQIIVASHSPVVLESVPEEARLFLDRDEDSAEVRLVPPYRDILQKALYGQSREQLSILCEDQIAEGIIRGFLDVLNLRLELRHDDVVIGRDTGRDEFPAHIRTLGKFGKLDDFLVVLDGDSKSKETDLLTAASEYHATLQPLFLPGDGPPEGWIWDVLEEWKSEYALDLGIGVSDLDERMRNIQQLASGMVQQQDPAKVAVEELSREIGRTPSDIARLVGKREAERTHGEGLTFLTLLQEQITSWRQRGA
ncbi:MAG: AAA family ATPase [Chloroflexota bacterium]|nr:AAA family ATPase [Chloroflexota bacterium]